MKRAYWTLLGLFPADYRALFAVEMLTAFEKAAEDGRAQGLAAVIRFLVVEFLSLMTGAGMEWIAKWTTDSSVRGRSLPDLRMMRPPGVPGELWFAGAWSEPPENFSAATPRHKTNGDGCS